MGLITNLVAVTVVHAEAAGPAAEAVTLGAKVLSVAGVAKHFSIVLRDAARVQHFSAIGCKEKEKMKVFSGKLP